MRLQQVAGILVIVAATLVPAKAQDLLNFDFTISGGFYDADGGPTPATVTGEIIGLKNNATSFPSEVIIDPNEVTPEGAVIKIMLHGGMTVTNGNITNSNLYCTENHELYLDLNYEDGGYYVLVQDLATSSNVIQSATISYVPDTVKLSGLNAVYNGSPHGATVVTTPPGLAVDVTYTDSQDETSSSPPTDAGTYEVNATVTEADYSGSATGTLVIAQARASVKLGDLSATYDGDAHGVTATTVPSGLNVMFTYTDSEGHTSSDAPTDAGVYTVEATVDDPNYTGSATGVLEIAKAKATVTVTSDSVTYDGNAHGLEVRTDPADLEMDVTYDGETGEPTDADTYKVVATIADPNYEGSGAGTLTIEKAKATVTLSDLEQTYDGSVLEPTVTTVPEDLDVSVVYAKSKGPINAGSYPFTATITNPNYTGSATGAFLIDKATATITFGNLSFTYNGKAQPATATTDPVGLAVKFTYNGKTTVPVNEGTYAVVATVNAANYAGTKNGTLTIAPASATVLVKSATVVYTGKPIAATATTVPAKLPVSFTYQKTGGSPTSEAPTAAGTYTVVGTVTNPNYSGSGTGTLTIKPPAPLATTAAATGIAAASATLNATVNPKGVDTTVTFQYGTTTAYAGGTTASQDIGSGTVNKAVSAAISGLAPATTYHYRVVASSAGGVVDGLDKTFKTPAQALIPLAKAATKASVTAVVGESVLRQGDVAPGLGDAVFSSFSEPASDETGGFAFVATLKQGVGGITRRNDAGLWATDASGDLRLIAQTGEAAPGCPTGAVFISFDTFALADKGVVFVATISGGGTTAADDAGIWFADAAGNVRLIIRAGDELEGKTVTGVDLGVSSDGNEVVAKVSFRDGSDAVLDVESP